MSDIPALAAQTIFQDAHITDNPQTAPLTSLELPSKHSHPHDHPITTEDPEGRTYKKSKTTHDPTTASAHDTIDHSDDAASISSSILHRHPHNSSSGGSRRQRAHLPPLPDLRFEQSYLASIAPAEGDVWGIVVITVRDQVVFPLVQGTLFSLGLAGWRAWHGKARFLGRGVGAKVRRWWWGVNNWKVPE
ncbi:hypothetical protein DFH27DRAFT_511643 [Peziza echinospora]|nr:hypothetical protein DFH27DRAFT_511643 [Peziza echinospora]